MNPDYVFQVDSDNQFSPDDFITFWERRHESPFLLGIRRNRQDPMTRIFISRFLSWFLKEYFEAEVTDANVPFRLFEKEFLNHCLVTIPFNVFAPNIFISAIAARHLGNFPQIQVVHKERKTGTVSIVRWSLIKACLRCVKELFSFKFTMTERLRVLKDFQAKSEKQAA